MALEKFSLGALSTIDNGKVAAAFAHALRRCEEDCKDRPAVDTARTIMLDIQITPVVGDDGALESVNVSFRIKNSVPERQSKTYNKTYNMQATRGGLLFNELSPDDVRQGTLDSPGPRAVGGE